MRNRVQPLHSFDAFWHMINQICEKFLCSQFSNILFSINGSWTWSELCCAYRHASKNTPTVTSAAQVHCYDKTLTWHVDWKGCIMVAGQVFIWMRCSHGCKNILQKKFTTNSNLMKCVFIRNSYTCRQALLDVHACRPLPFNPLPPGIG